MNWPTCPLRAGDVSQLAKLDFEFESDWLLAVEKETGDLAVTWRLRPRKLETPFRSNDFGPTAESWRELEETLEAGEREGFVVEMGGRPVAMVELEVEEWRSVGLIWNLLVHRPFRGRGMGTALLEAAIAWGKRRRLRALTLETQTNNWAALNFYQRRGFVPCGIDDHFYTNRDRERGEVALFWVYELEGEHGEAPA